MHSRTSAAFQLCARIDDDAATRAYWRADRRRRVRGGAGYDRGALRNPGEVPWRFSLRYRFPR